MTVLTVATHVADADGRFLGRTCMTWCPGCEQMHPFRVESTDGLPTWEWDGNETAPTFAPSLLVHSSVHLCPDEHLVTCPGGDCGHIGHMTRPDGSLSVYGPHTVDPAYGNCHSFLRAGVWEFLPDSAHALAGQRVPMVPLPDWYLGDDTKEDAGAGASDHP